MPSHISWTAAVVGVVAVLLVVPESRGSGDSDACAAARRDPGADPQSAQFAKTDDELEAEALRIVAAEQGVSASGLEVAYKAVATYPETGRQSFDVKVLNLKTQGTHGVSLDRTGKPLSREDLGAQERAAHVARYGKLDPDLAVAVACAAPGESFHILVWVVQPPYVDPFPEPRIGSPEAKARNASLTLADIEAQGRARLEYHTARASALVQPLLAELKGRGIDAEELMGAVLLVAPADLIRELNTNPLVDSIGSQTVADDDVAEDEE